MAGGLLPSRCIATIKNTHTYTDWWEGFTKYAVEMCLDSTIYEYIPSFIKIGSSIQKLIGGMHRHTDSMAIAEAYFISSKHRKLTKNES
jgi:hypothetical protein